MNDSDNGTCINSDGEASEHVGLESENKKSFVYLQDLLAYKDLCGGKSRWVLYVPWGGRIGRCVWRLVRLISLFTSDPINLE